MSSSVRDVCLEEGSILTLISDYFETAGHAECLLALEQFSCGASSQHLSLPVELTALRQMVLEGRWDQVGHYLDRFSEAGDEEGLKNCRYLVQKQKYLESLHHVEFNIQNTLRLGFSCCRNDGLLKACVGEAEKVQQVMEEQLNVLEGLCPTQTDHQSLKDLLSVPSISSSREFCGWQPQSGRLDTLYKIQDWVSKMLCFGVKTQAKKPASKSALLRLLAKGLLYEQCEQLCRRRCGGEEGARDLASNMLDLREWLQQQPDSSFQLPPPELSLVVSPWSRAQPQWVDGSFSVDMGVIHREEKHALHCNINLAKSASAFLPTQLAADAAEVVVEGGGEVTQNPSPAGAGTQARDVQKPAQSGDAAEVAVEGRGEVTQDPSPTGAGTDVQKPAQSAGAVEVAAGGRSEVIPPPTALARDVQKSSAQSAGAVEVAAGDRSGVTQDPPPAALARNVEKPKKPAQSAGASRSAKKSPRPASSQLPSAAGPPHVQHSKEKKQTWSPAKESQVDGTPQTNKTNTSSGHKTEPFLPSTTPLHKTTRLSSTPKNVKMARGSLQTSPPSSPIPATPAIARTSPSLIVDKDKEGGIRKLDFQHAQRWPSVTLLGTITDSQAVRSVAFSESGRFAAVGSNSGILRVCTTSSLLSSDKQSSRELDVVFEQPHCHRGSIYCLAWYKDRLLASGSNDRHISLLSWSSDSATPNTKPRKSPPHSGTIRDILFTSEGLMVYGGGVSPEIVVTDMNSYKDVVKLAGHTDQVLTLGLLPGGFLASGGQDKTVLMWDLRSPTPASSLKLSQPVASLTSSWESLVVSHLDGSCAIYDLNNFKCVSTYTAHTKECRTVRYHPKSSLKDRWVLSGSYDKSVCLTNTGNLQWTRLCQHQDKVIQCRWHPDGNMFASTGVDKKACFWRLNLKSVQRNY